MIDNQYILHLDTATQRQFNTENAWLLAMLKNRSTPYIGSPAVFQTSLIFLISSICTQINNLEYMKSQ